MVSATPAVPASVDAAPAAIVRPDDDEFFALVYSDHELLRDEFDELIAASWSSPPPAIPIPGDSDQPRSGNPKSDPPSVRVRRPADGVDRGGDRPTRTRAPPGGLVVQRHPESVVPAVRVRPGPLHRRRQRGLACSPRRHAVAPSCPMVLDGGFERVRRGQLDGVGNRVLLWALALCVGLLIIELTIFVLTANWFAIALTLAAVAGVVAAAFATAGHRR